MDKLIKYLNAMSKDDQLLFAERCKTTIGYLRKAASACQLLAIATCVHIERESNFAVTRQDLRPTDYMENWPDLITPPAFKAPKQVVRSR